MTEDASTAPTARRRGTHSAQRLSDQETTRQLQDELRAIGGWVLDVVTTQPGWQRMILDLKPQGGRLWLRISEERDGKVQTGTVGALNASSPVMRHVDRLQALSYRPGRGTWFATSVIVIADQWPEPEHRFTALHGFDDRPGVFGEEGPYGLEDALEHLARFPRTEDRVPPWLGRMAAEQDRVIEVLPPEATTQAASADTINPLLREAVLGFASAPSDQSMIEVLRQFLQGKVLVDASGSDLVPGPGGEQIGPESVVRLQSLRETDGTVSLAVYTSAEDARQAYRRSGQEGEPTLLEQPAAVLLGIIAQDQHYGQLVVDPGTATCRIPRRQIEWAMASPRNDVVKSGLVSGSIPQMLGGMVGRESRLLVAVPARADGDDAPQPVRAMPADDGPADTLYIFTSVVEVAALDPALEARAASGRDVLRLAVDSGAARICLNARAPLASFAIQDIVELLDSMEQAEREGQGGGPLPQGLPQQDAGAAGGLWPQEHDEDDPRPDAADLDLDFGPPRRD